MGDDVVAASRHNSPDVLDAPGWVRYLNEHRPEVLYHLAGQASVAESWVNPAATFEVNALGTLHVLSACRDAKVSRVVVVSSSDVYGHVGVNDLPITESAPLRPVTPYAASKAAAEQVAVQAFCGFEQYVVIARAFTHIGVGQDDRFVAAALALRIADNERSGAKRVPVGNLTPQRDFSDVRDVVAAYRLLAAHGQPGATYNVCSGHAVAIHQLAHWLLGSASHPMQLAVQEDLQRPVEVPRFLGDNRRLVAATNWQPTHTLPETLNVVLADARRRVSQHPGTA